MKYVSILWILTLSWRMSHFESCLHPREAVYWSSDHWGRGKEMRTLLKQWHNSFKHWMEKFVVILVQKIQEKPLSTKICQSSVWTCPLVACRNDVGYWSNEAFKCYCSSFFIHSELSPFHGIIRDHDAVERRKLGVNKERTAVALKGFIWSISHILWIAHCRRWSLLRRVTRMAGEGIKRSLILMHIRCGYYT